MLQLEFQKWQKTEARVHSAICISLFQIVWQDKNISLFFSVVTVHLAEKNDRFGHTRRIGWFRTFACLLVQVYL